MQILAYSFGSITIEDRVYTKDVWIINGKIRKRDKSIAKKKFGTSHRISRKELENVVTKRTKKVLIGSGESGLVSLTKKATQYLEEKEIKLEMHKTSELAKMKMEIEEEDSGIIHLTC